MIDFIALWFIPNRFNLVAGTVRKPLLSKWSQTTTPKHVEITAFLGVAFLRCRT